MKNATTAIHRTMTDAQQYANQKPHSQYAATILSRALKSVTETANHALLRRITRGQELAIRNAQDGIRASQHSIAEMEQRTAMSSAMTATLTIMTRAQTPAQATPNSAQATSLRTPHA